MSDPTSGTWDGRDSAAIVRRETKLPQLGDAPKGNNPREAAFYQALTQIINAGTSTGAGAGDRFITVRDALNSGLLTHPDGSGGNGSGTIGGLPLIPRIPSLPSDHISLIPPAPIDFIVDPGLTSLILSWGYPTGGNPVGYTEIYASGTNDFGTKVLIGTATALVYADAVGSTGVDRYYWIRAVGTGDTPLDGPFFSLTPVYARTGTINGTDFSDLLIEAHNIDTGAVIADKIADGILTVAKFAAGIAPIGVITASTLPDPLGYTGPQVVFFQGKIWRYVGGAWTKQIDGADVDGSFAATIADGSISFAKFATGLEPVGVVGTLPALVPNPPGYVGPRTVILTTDSKLYRLNDARTAWTSATAATDITGALTSTQISDHAITTAKIDAFAITANEIAANAITAGKIQAGAVTADQLAANSVVAGKIAAGAVSADSLQANSVVAGKIAAGAISTDQLQAGAVRAQNLLITATSLIPDTMFAGGASMWNGFANQYLQGNPALPPGCPTPSACTFVDRVNSYKVTIPVDPGSQLRARITVNRSGTGQQAGFVAQFFDANGAYLSAFVGTTTANGWQTLALPFTIPDNTAIMACGPFIDVSTDNNGNYAWFTDLTVVRMSDASLIVDGAVTATKIAAGAVVAGAIAADAIAAANIIAGSITGDRIAAATLTAANILAGAITGDRIAANTITSTNIVARTIQALQIAANTITAYEIQATSISADRLTVGAQGATANLLKNSDFTEKTGTDNGPTSLKNWNWYYNVGSAQIGRNYSGGQYWNVGNGGAWLYDNGNIGSADFSLIESDRMGAAPYQTYEFSCYVAALNCIAYMDLHFTKADDTDCATPYLGSVNVNAANYGGVAGGSTGIASMIRLWSKAAAPADAAFVRLRVYKGATLATYVDSYLFINRAMLSLDAFSQASISNQAPWRDGGLTTIDGRGILTNTITADAIQADAITAPKINVGTLAEISSNAGVIVSGMLRNATGTAAINLDAINSDDFIRVGNYVTQYDGSFNPNIALRADGSAYFSREVISKPKRLAHGNYPLTTNRPRIDFGSSPPGLQIEGEIQSSYLTDNYKTIVWLNRYQDGGGEGGGGGDGGGD